MSVLSPSQLQKLRYSCQRWLEVLKTDMNLLDGTGYSSSLLSIANLGDVEISGLANNDILRYDSVSGTWKNVPYGFLTTTTTTTTTTTAP